MRSTSWLKTGCFALLVVAISVTGSGCESSNARGKVKGRVKFFDKYLTAGTVIFTTKDDRSGSGNIDSEGNYEVADAPIGECTITVKVPTFERGRGMQGPPKAPPGVPDMRSPDGGDTDKNFVPNNFDPSKIVQIPAKYGAVETSGLTYTVVKGEQTKDITLSP